MTQLDLLTKSLLYTLCLKMTIEVSLRSSIEKQQPLAECAIGALPSGTLLASYFPPLEFFWLDLELRTGNASRYF